MEIDIAALPIPGMKGSIPSIRIPKLVIDRGLQFCQFSLVGQFDFQKNQQSLLEYCCREMAPKRLLENSPTGKRQENQHATEAANHRRRSNRNRQNNNREAGTSGDKDSQGVPIPTPISTGTGETLPENVVGLEAGDAQTQEAGTNHVDAIPQVGVAENIVIDAVALLPLAVEMQSVHPLNAPQGSS
ncbi:hypothetical protein IFM89_008782 [Coptis chinensis]|uniref:Uncharacterized protein n=1 Tax=Coptis chinensis TaxID=261450 RepID=A0A835LDE1_9MAGN|nr:hypothetical protein IFM89_008782 [Coptis chinensis]